MLSEFENINRQELSQKYDALKKQIFRNFPLIENEDDPKFQDFRQGNKNFCSFDISGEMTPFQKNLLITTLHRASNPQDKLFCAHGERHPTFKHAMQTLIHCVKNESVKIDLHQINITKPSKKHGKLNYQTIRWLLQSPIIKRNTMHSLPHHCALEINRISNNDSHRLKLVRRIAGKQGIPFTLLTSAYLRLKPQEALKILTNPQVRKNITSNFGESLRFPSTSRGSDKKMYAKIKNTLFHEAKGGTSVQNPLRAYRKSLNILKDYGYLASNPQKTLINQSIEVQENTTAFAPMMGIMEFAQIAINPPILDPSSNPKFKDTFLPYTTPRIATCYLKVEQKSFPRLYF